MVANANLYCSSSTLRLSFEARCLHKSLELAIRNPRHLIHLLYCAQWNLVCCLDHPTSVREKYLVRKRMASLALDSNSNLNSDRQDYRVVLCYGIRSGLGAGVDQEGLQQVLARCNSSRDDDAKLGNSKWKNIVSLGDVPLRPPLYSLTNRLPPQQPGSLLTHWEGIPHAATTILGALTLIAAICSLFYTTASDAST